MLKLTITTGGNEVDYTKFVDWTSLSIQSNVNVPRQLTVSVIPSSATFVVPVPRAYVRVYSSVTQRSLFTGFIASEPKGDYVSLASFVSQGIRGQLFTYQLTCSSDEYLINTKSVPFIPAFINRTQGDILSKLASLLCPGFYDTSLIADGDLVPFFEYTPGQSWSEVAKQFGDGSRHRYSAIDRKLIYQPYGDGPLGIVYDERLGSSNVAPKELDTGVLDVPVVNDVTIIGAVEAGNNREDYFLGGGFAEVANQGIPLLHKVFRGESTTLLQETWNGNGLNGQQWLLFPPANTDFDFTAGALNIIMPSGTVRTLGESVLSLVNGLELAGGINIQNGEVTFNNVCTGIIGGIYKDNLFTSTSLLAGFKLTSPSGVTFGTVGVGNIPGAAIGVGGVHIQPVFNGDPVGDPFITQINHTYLLQIVIHAPQYTRYNQIYRTTEGVEYGGHTSDMQGSVTFIIQDNDIAVSAFDFFHVRPVTKVSVDNVDLPAFVAYAIADAQRLNVTITGTTIAQMPLGGLVAFEGPQGLAMPTGIVLPLLPNHSTNYAGPVAPWSSSASGSILPAPDTLETVPTVEVLGNGFDQQAAQITAGNSADFLSFYGNTNPVVGTPIRLQTWEAQAAVSRLQDKASIDAEKFIVGDDGIRSAIVTDLSPLPRTSEECDSAALAYLADRVQVFKKGQYVCTDVFFHGLQSDIEYFPVCGRYLHIHSAGRGLIDTKSLVVGVTIKALEAAEERLEFNIQFGPDLHLEKILKHFVDIAPQHILTAQDKAAPPVPRFTQAVDNSFLPDLNNVRVDMTQILPDNVKVDVFDDYTGPIEVRRIDSNWGKGPTTDLLGIFFGPSFTLPRRQFDQQWFLRPVQGVVTSRRSKVLRVRWPLRPARPVLSSLNPIKGVGPDGSVVDTLELQFNYQGGADTRHVYGFELRGADNTTVLVQKPVFPPDISALDIDLSATPFLFLPGVSGDTALKAYFFNHQWDYSDAFTVGETVVVPATSVPANPSSVNLTEVADSRFMDKVDQTTHATFEVAILTPDSEAEFVVVWLSKNNGADFDIYLGQFAFTPTLDAVRFQQFVPAATDGLQWKARVTTGNSFGENAPETGAITATLNVTPIQPASANGVTGAGFGLARVTVTAHGSGYTHATASAAGGSGSGAVLRAVIQSSGFSPGIVLNVVIDNPGYGYQPEDTVVITISGDGTGAGAVVEIGAIVVFDNNGKINWAIPAIGWKDPELIDHTKANFDPYTWFTVLTFQAVDVAGNPAPAELGGTEVEVARFADDGTKHYTDNIGDWGFQPDGSAYVYAELRIYSVNRNSVNSWQDGTSATLEACWPSAAQSRRVRFQNSLNQISAVSFAEVGTRFADPDDKLAHLTLKITLTLTNPFANIIATYWISFDNGSTWTWISFASIDPATPTIDVDVLVPSVSTNWKVAAHSDVVGRTPLLPTDAEISGSLLIDGYHAPANNLLSTLTITAPNTGTDTTADFPYNRVMGPERLQDWNVPSISYDDTPVLVNPYAFVITITATDLGVSGSAIGVEHTYGALVVSREGAVIDRGNLAGPYGSVADPVRSADIASVRLKVYIGNRLNTDTNAWQDTATNTLQVNIGGTGVGHKDFLVATNGLTPPGLFPTDRIDPKTLGGGLTDKPDGTVGVQTVNDPVEFLNFEQGTFEDWTNTGGWTVDGGAPINGGFSGKVVAPNPNATIFKSIPCQAGDQFRAAFTFKSVGGVGAHIQISVVYFSATVALANNNSGPIPPNPTPQLVNIGPFVAPPGTITVAVDVFVDGGFGTGAGTYYVDDIILVRVLNGTGGVEIDQFGNTVAAIAPPLFIDINNRTNIRIASDFVVTTDPVTHLPVLGQGVVDLAKATNFDLTNFKKANGVFLVNAIAVNNLIAGDALFAGQATFAFLGNNALSVNSNVTSPGNHAFNFASGSFPIGQRVRATAVGITPVTWMEGRVIGSITGSILMAADAFAGVSGGTFTNWLLQLDGGIVRINADGITIADSIDLPVSTVAISATGISIVRGISSVKITAAAVTIDNGVLNTPAINVVSGLISLNINATDVFKLVDASANDTKITMGVGGAVGSIRIGNQADTQYVQINKTSVNFFGGGFNVIELRTTGLIVRLTPTLFSQVGPSGFLNIFDNNPGVNVETSGFTGTVAAALAAGKRVVGGVIVN